MAAHTLSIALLPVNPKAYLQRGRAHGRLNNPARAIADYSKALAFLPAEYVEELKAFRAEAEQVLAGK